MAAPSELELQTSIAALPTDHALAGCLPSYRDGFIRAFMTVYGGRADWQQKLKEKFFIPHHAAYTADRFLQHAAELSVGHHVARHAPGAFAIDRQMPPPGKGDVDVYYECGAAKIALEVKCPEERLVPADAAQLGFDGRHPDHERIFAEISGVLAGAVNLPSKLQRLQRAPHHDNKLKDFLLSADRKFSSPELEDLNVLFVAVGEELQPWISFLQSNEGLFTPRSFWPSADFARVQVVVLSNLKYFHTTARAHHDWTLSDVFMLPVFNPLAARQPVSDTYRPALSIFRHHLESFARFHPVSADPNVDQYMAGVQRLLHYIHGELSDADFHRHFPATVRRGPKRGPTH